jgi:hypothetical protein
VSRGSGSRRRPSGRVQADVVRDDAPDAVADPGRAEGGSERVGRRLQHRRQRLPFDESRSTRARPPMRSTRAVSAGSSPLRARSWGRTLRANFSGSAGSAPPSRPSASQRSRASSASWRRWWATRSPGVSSVVPTPCQGLPTRDRLAGGPVSPVRGARGRCVHAGDCARTRGCGSRPSSASEGRPLAHTGVMSPTMVNRASGGPRTRHRAEALVACGSHA